MEADISGADIARGGALARRPAPRRLSQIFRELARQSEAPVSIGRIRDAMGDRSFAALLILFSAFNLLPLPPGSTLIFGIPLILVSAQMVLGYRTAWLPRRILDRAVAPERFQRATHRLVPLLERMESIVRPRSWPFPPGGGDRMIGAIALVLSIAVFLPIPFGNWMPAFATATIGLAMSERDGTVFAIGIAIGVASLLVIGGVVGAAGVLASMVFG